jgi:lysozyme
MALVRRRWLAVVVSTLAVAGIVGTGFWFVWMPGYRPGLEKGEHVGVDVSAHQGAIDWRRVATDGIEFAYVKATEGADHADARFVRNWTRARRAGLRLGAYHFFTLCRSGVDQAENFLGRVPDDPDALAPALDLELAGNCSQRPSRTTLRRDLDAFVARVESATGRRVVLYVGDDFEHRYHLTATFDRPVWTRNLLRRPGDERWQVWQANDRGQVEGINADVDIDVMRPGAS